MQEGTNSLRKLRRDWWKTKLCTACVSPLGRFLSRGGTCPQCGLRVCKNCRSESQSGAWVCVLCSGGMPSDDLAKTTKSLGRDSRSIRRSWTISNPQRAQTNSPILKSYTVLYPEDGDGGVMTDGSSGSNSGVGCSASTGHLSTLEDTTNSVAASARGGGGVVGSSGKKKFLFGGSDQGIHNNHHHSGGQHKGRNSKDNIGYGHYISEVRGGDCVINQRNNGACGANHGCNKENNVNGSTRQFHSLPRMTTGGLSLFEPASSPSATQRVIGVGGSKQGKRSFNSDFEKDNIKRHRSFQTTLHPYTPSPPNNPPSPAASVNFIEETFWDYYDYEIENSTSSDTNSTPRNFRKSATAAAISATTASRRPLDSNNIIIGTNKTTPNETTNKNSSTSIISKVHEKKISPRPISKLIAAFRTDSNRSSCERSLGETMDYDCSLRMNQYSSLSDTEINDTNKYEENKNRNGGMMMEDPSSYPTEYRRHSNTETVAHPRSNYYATISSTTNPYLPASEYVYRRRHDHDGVMLNEAPPKPERKFRNNKRSVSLNAYDGRRLFSPLRTYCVLMKENIEPGDRVEDNGGRNVNNNNNTTTTSAILNNSSPISLSFTNTSSSLPPQCSQAPQKFNSLPRERIIRIEREDGDGSTNPDKYSSLKLPSSTRKTGSLLLGRSVSSTTTTPEVLNVSSPREKNITRVPIVKDDSELGGNSKLSSLHNSQRSGNPFPPKNKIERSQSYKEISSSRPYPYYHQYHSNQNHNNNTTAQNMIQRQIQHPEKSSTRGDLNYMHAGTTSTLPNFRSKSGLSCSANKPTSLSLTSPTQNSTKSINLWDMKQDSGGIGAPENNFFRSDFDDESDIVIENFIKSHSGSTTADNSVMSNTLPKRKYPPSTTHITISSTSSRNHHEPSQERVNDREYNIGGTTTTSKISDFSPDTSDNYLRQCSTFPRGATTQVKKDYEIVDAAQNRTDEREQLPNFFKTGTTMSNKSILRNSSSSSSPSADIPISNSNTKGYPYFDKSGEVPFQQNNSTSRFDVPKQKTFSQNNERIHPIKVESQNVVKTAIIGPGSSATLPHPYIRRNKQLLTAAAENSSENKVRKNINSTPPAVSGDNSGPSISEVEMAIERDIFYQKTRSLDRIRPSSKSKLKSVLSLGKSSNDPNGNASSSGGGSVSNLHHHSQQLHPMEIDYSDSQPYKNNYKGSSQNDNIFSLSQSDRNYANGRNGSSDFQHQLLLEPQQIHHSSSSTSSPPSHPIPSPRLKRKAKMQNKSSSMSSSSNSNSHNEFSASATLSTPKINGDEMSPSTSSTAPTKLIGPGTNYGSKKVGSNISSSSSSPPSVTTCLLNEPDHYNQSQQQREPIKRNEIQVDNAITPNARKSSPSTDNNNPNLISLGNNATPNAISNSTSMKFGSAKETSIKSSTTQTASALADPTFTVGMTSVTNNVSADGPIKSEKSMSVVNHISQPSHGSVTPNYSNSDNPGVNFMISSNQNQSSLSSSSPELDLQLQHQNQHHNPNQHHHNSHHPHQYHSLQRQKSCTMEPNSNNPNQQQQIKSALANSSGGNLPKAVRFEPSVIAMDFESQQRKLLQQQQQQQQPHVSGTGGSTMNNNNNGINSGTGDGNVNGSGVFAGGNAVLKSNSGNHMQKHGHYHNHHNHNHGNKGRPHHHYVHASSYLPVLYHSYHQQQHKYIRKGNGQNGPGTGGGKKSKSKKYKGFVARAIAKVKSKAAASIKNKESSSSSTTNSVPTVYYPVGKSQASASSSDTNSKGSSSVSSSSSQQHPYISDSPAVSASAPSGNSSVITYISPHPQQQHQQPPVQQALEESQQKLVVPSITVSLSSTSSSSSPEGVDKTSNNSKLSSIHSTKGINSTSPQVNESRRFNSGAAGRLKRNGKNGSGKLSGRRMDGYLDNHEGQGGIEDSEEGLRIPDSFRLHIDGLTPSSTSSSSSSSYTSNLQESYELYHNQTLPENVCEIVKAETVEAPSSVITSKTQISKNDYSPDKKDKTAEEVHDLDDDDDEEEKYDSLNEEDEDSDNANDDGPFYFKSFEESDSDEGEEPDFVYYSTQQPQQAPHKSNMKPGMMMMGSKNSSSSGSARHYNIDTDRSIKTIASLSSSQPLPPPTSQSQSSSSTEFASYAPFASSNETTTKGSHKNHLNTSSTQYSDLHQDNGENNKGKSSTCNAASVSSSSEPKMVVSIPTYRSPSSRRQIMNQRHHHHPQHYGKSQTSIPTASTSSAALSNTNVANNVGVASSSKFSENVIMKQQNHHSPSTKEPHPLLRQDLARVANNSHLLKSSKEPTSVDKNGLSSSMGANVANAAESSSKSKNSFGIHKDSSRSSALDFQRSNNNRHDSISVEDVSLSSLSSSLEEKMKKGLSQEKIVEKHGKNVNQVGMAGGDNDDDNNVKAILQSQSQPQRNNIKAGLEASSRHYENREHERARVSSSTSSNIELLPAPSREVHEHAGNLEDDEDTLQKDVEHVNKPKNVRTSDGIIVTSDEQYRERVSSGVSHDASQFLEISSSKREDEKKGIASATTTGNSTGASTKRAPSSDNTKEGRLTDLTSSTKTSSRGQQQLASASTPKIHEEDEGLHLLLRSSHANGEDSLKNSVKNKNAEKIVEKEEDSSILQARTCSWASNNTKGSPSSTGNIKRKNHNTVTNITNESGKEDAERLQRLELVKSRQNILKASFKIPTSEESLQQDQQVNNCENNEGDSSSSRNSDRAYNSLEYLHQPNSLETQCANDQSFLSESEVSSSVGAKSPSPSPRFKRGNKVGRRGGQQSPKYLYHHHQRSSPQQYLSKSGGDSEEEERILTSSSASSSSVHHHLLNTQQTRKGKQSKSESISSSTSRESTQSPSASPCPESRDQDSPIFYRDSSSGPSGMSILPPQNHQTTAAAPSTSSSVNESANNNFGKFKSRVFLNSNDLKNHEELSGGVKDKIIGHNKVANNSNKSNQRNGNGASSSATSVVPGKKNITTVEISGDVGIVSNNLQLSSSCISNSSSNCATNGSSSGNNGNGVGASGPSSFASSVLNDNSINRHHHHHHHHHHQPLLSSDHLQSSGLSLIPQPNLLEQSSSEEEDSLDDGERPIEPKIRAKFRTGQFSLDRSEVQSCDNDTEKNTTSDDNSSDWQSESTNTVIFRGSVQQTLAELGGGTSVDSDFYGAPSSYLDPEIQINNITVGDENNDIHNNFGNGNGTGSEHTGNGITSSSSSSTTQSQQQTINRDSTSNTSGSKVNVGYKANKVSKVSSDLIIGIKKSSADNNNAPTSLSTSQNSSDIDVKVGSKRKFDKSNDVSSSSSSCADSSEELGKSNETLTDIGPDQIVSQQQQTTRLLNDQLEVEMVISPEKKQLVNANNSYLHQNNQKSPAHHRRESPEGQEQEVPEASFSNEKGGDNKDLILGEKSSQLSNQVVPNAKEKKMEETGGDGGGGGTGSAADNVSNNNGGAKAKKKCRGTINKEKILQNVLSQIPSRSSPDGADADKSDATPEPEVESPPGVIDNFDVTSDEDSWVEEILFEDEDDHSFEEAVKKLPPPLDLTLHTIVEESCEESEAENSGNFYQPSTSGLGGSQKNPSLSQSESNANELEKYFNFGIYNDPHSQAKNSLPHEESEFSDTFSESSFSLQEDDFDNGTQEGLLDPAELASTRLEKYFYNLGGPPSMNQMNQMNSTITLNQSQQDSDSVGSESDSDNSVLEKRKKVLKHHRRSADFEEELGDKVSDEEDSFGFGQDGFDTIKKTARKTKKSGSEGSISGGDHGNSSTGNQTGSLNTGGENVDNNSEPSNRTSVMDDRSPKALKKSDLESSSSNKSTTNPSDNTKPVIKVNRSNSFTWSSDEEVNIMMSKLRQLIKNLIKSKAEAGTNSGQAGTLKQSSTSDNSSGVGGAPASNKDKQLVYLENELIRLMKTDHLKNIVEYLSSEESDVDDVYKFIKVVNSSGSTPVDLDDLGDLGDLDIDDPNLLENLQSTMQLQEDGALLGAGGVSPKSSPALLAKVMHHIGNRLNMWMKDEGNLEDDNNDDTVTLKCAPSVSSDLNEDRFSWKGSFESALAAKRQSVGSTDSISSSDYGQDKSMLRSSSLHHLTTSQPIEENKEEEEPASSLPRMTNLCNSLPRLNQPNNPAISRAHSLVMTAKSEQPGNETYPVSISGPVKSARYRPPGFQPTMKAKRIDTEEKASPATLSQSTPVLTQDPAILKNRSDSMGSIFHDVKPLISVKGQVEFGLQYNYKLACLEVKVVGCRDLAAADSKRNRSDPYVKAYLLPDKSKAGKRKTKTKKNTLHPIFDEILKFPLTLSDLQNRTLWLSVWHSDMFGKNEFLGEILVNLKDRVFDDPNPGWWDLQEMSGQMEDMPKGDLVIALKWQPKTDSTGNLSVLVKEAKNLVPVKNGSPSTFVKCALLSDKTRKQKTSICRRNFNPIWNQTLLFEDVDDEGIEITIWNHDLLASHDLIGTVRLEYDNPLWESMISRPSFWVEGGLKLS